MIFTPLPITGAWLIEPEPISDERGFFARVMSQAEFLAKDIKMDFVQVSMSHSLQKGTLRGMHFQIPPHEETKLVRVISGSLFDVLVDLRPESSTYLKVWHGMLSAESRLLLVVPRGVAHGFQTTRDHTEVLYHMDTAFAPNAARTFCWNDPQFSIPWPLKSPILSPKDASAAPFKLDLLS